MKIVRKGNSGGHFENQPVLKGNRLIVKRLYLTFSKLSAKGDTDLHQASIWIMQLKPKALNQKPMKTHALAIHFLSPA